MKKKLLNEATDFLQNDKEIPEELMKELEEAVTMSMTQRSREAKINAAISAIAVSIAKQKNDPLVHKMLKYRHLWKETKNHLVQKYGALAHQKWVQNQSKIK